MNMEIYFEGTHLFCAENKNILCVVPIFLSRCFEFAFDLSGRPPEGHHGYKNPSFYVVRGRARILENLIKVKQLNKLILTIKHFTRVFFSHYLFPSKATRNHFKCYENNILLQYVRTKLTGTASKLIWKWPFFERFFFYFIELLFAEVTDWAQSNNSGIFAIKKRLFQNKNKKKRFLRKSTFGACLRSYKKLFQYQLHKVLGVLFR